MSDFEHIDVHVPQSDGLATSGADENAPTGVNPSAEPSAEAPSPSPSPAALASVPRSAVSILDRVHLLIGESLAEFQDLRDSIFAALKPDDIIEQIWAVEFTHLVWAGLRERRFHGALIRSTSIEVLHQVLRGYFGDKVGNLAWDWVRRDAAATEKVKAMLTQVGLTVETIEAQAYSRRIEELEVLDRVILAKSIRRDSILREIERHRVAVQERRRLVEEPQDAEFETVEPNSVAAEPIAEPPAAETAAANMGSADESVPGSES